MFRIAILVWLMLGTVLAGSAVVAVVSNDALFDQGMRLIPIAAAAGFAVAVPLALMIARRLAAGTGGR